MPPAAKSSPGRARGVVLSLSAAFWAALFLIPYQAAVERAPRGSVMAGMLLAAAVFNQVIALVTERRRAFAFDGPALEMAGVLTVGTVLGNASIALALPAIGPGMTSVVMKAQVLITPLLSLWILSERASARLWLGGALALLGFGIPQVVGGATVIDVGYLWAMASAWVFAAMQVLTRRRIHQIRVAPVNALRLWLSVALLLALPARFGGGSLVDLDQTTWGLAAAAGVLGPGISRLCLMTSVRYVTASTTALLSLVGPVFAFVLGWIAFEDVPSVAECVGAVLILAGILWPMLERRGR